METDTRLTEDHATNSTVDWSKSSFLWASKLPRLDNWLVGVSTLPSSLASEGYVCILDWIALTETPIWVQIHPLIAHPGTCSTSFLEWTRLSELGLCYSQIYLVQLQPGCAVTLQSCLPRTAILCDSLFSPSSPSRTISRSQSSGKELLAGQGHGFSITFPVPSWCSAQPWQSHLDRTFGWWCTRSYIVYADLSMPR